MYFGETPSVTKRLSVGVMPLVTKSALKPSRDIRMVVGANSDVPLESSMVPGGIRDLWEAL